ncbi:MAG: methyltransferase domain-containing protein [Myxococcales bacterium]|nr:methyltransferase domain-containing protein [Myxococcales bacterium]
MTLPASGAPVPGQVHIPAAGPGALYCTLYHRDPGFAELAEAELLALGGGHAAEPGVAISTAPIRWARCAYAMAGGRQLAFAASLDALAAQLLSLRLVAPRFSIDTRRMPRRRKGASAAKTVIGNCIDGAVSIGDPQLRLLLVVSSLGYRVLVDTAAHPGDADWLRGGHKPHNYLVALPVRIAKAALNLTVLPGDTVLDPFCGSGTIPLLAAWAGHRAYGSDISAACVARAGDNIAHFGQQATLTCVDARACRQQADCIVTNLPYGVYSHLPREALHAVLRNLGQLAPRVTLVTAERIEDDLRSHGYVVQRVIAVEAARFERFVYVTRAPSATRASAR